MNHIVSMLLPQQGWILSQADTAHIAPECFMTVLLTALGNTALRRACSQAAAQFARALPQAGIVLKHTFQQ